MSADPFARALRDHHRSERDAPLLVHGDDETRVHPVAAFYFDDPERMRWLESWLDGPLIDLGAGVGRDARFLQERIETVAIEVNDRLVETMRERGVTDARRGDMFALRESFDDGRFRSALSHGTQLGLARSMDGLSDALAEVGAVTTADATAVVDGYDPDRPGTADLVGYRTDPRDGLARRTMQFEYEGSAVTGFGSCCSAPTGYGRPLRTPRGRWPPSSTRRRPTPATTGRRCGRPDTGNWKAGLAVRQHVTATPGERFQRPGRVRAVRRSTRRPHPRPSVTHTPDSSPAPGRLRRRPSRSASPPPR